MARPPKDPLRPLLRAALAAKVLGVGMFCCGVLYGVVAVDAYRSDPDVVDLEMQAMVFGISAAMMLLAGLACYVAGVYVRRRKFWAILLAMVIASLGLCFIGYSVVEDVRMDRPVSEGRYVILGAVSLAFLYLLVQLIRGFRALRRDPSVVHGFVPLMHKPSS